MQINAANGKNDLVFFKNNTNRDLYQNALKTLVPYKPVFVKPGYDTLVNTFNSKNPTGISF